MSNDAEGSSNTEVLSRFESALLNSLPDALIITDLHGRILEVNAGATEMFGHTREALVGQEVECLVPQALRTPHREHRQAYAASPVRRPIGNGTDLTGVRSNGEVFPVEISLSPWEGQGAIRVLCAIRDVTARKETERELLKAKMDLELRVLDRTRDLQESHEQLRTIIRAEPEGVMICNPDGSIMRLNPAGRELFGWGPDHDVNAEDLIQHTDPKDRDAVERHLEQAFTSRASTTLQFRLIGTDGSALEVESHSVALNDTVLCILRDRTMQVQQERQLRDQESLAQLGRMAAVIAHEIRNPLAGINGAVQLLKDGFAEDDPNRDLADEVIKSAGALAANLKEILAFSRPPSPEFVRLPLGDLLKNVLSFVAHDPLFEERHLSLHIEDDVTIRGDVRQLNQVFTNLLINAGQAIRKEGQVTVDLRLQGGKAQVTVEDDGVGIPDDVLDQIFEPFFTTKARGTGLGLATCKRFVETHKGTIVVSGRSPGGTRVVVTLPGL